MRATAVWFTRPREVELREEELPEVGPDQVRVEAIASAISHGTEMLVYRGQVSPELAPDLPTVSGGFGFPIKFGYASVGRVEEAGAEVIKLKPGDLVFCHHPHQSAYVVPASFPVRLPDHLPPEAGLFTANTETALNVVLDAHPRLSERVVVFGLGVVGILISRLLLRTGCQVVGVDPIAARRDVMRKLGVMAKAPEEVEKFVGEWTAGEGCDLVIEASGSPAALDQALRLVAFQGTVVCCSWYGEKAATLHLGDAFHRRRVRIVSSQVSNVDPAIEPRWNRWRRLETAVDSLASVQPQKLISHRFPISRASEAYELIDRQPEQALQVVFTY
jgi:2-desacetyl-2-hydroxyethyl bacteriochlorophyllide A dehydrogenase